MKDPTIGEIGWLLSGRCDLKASGALAWTDQNTNYVATLPVLARDLTKGTIRFIYRIGKKRASEPTLMIVYKDACVYRLDVNGSHRDGSKHYHFTTHVQRRKSLTDPTETFEANPVGVPLITVGERVTPRQYRDIFTTFAAPIGLDILDIVWTDPPEGRHP